MTLSRRTPLGPGAKSLARRSTFAAERTPLKRSESKRQRPISPASTAQREKCHQLACIVCARQPVHPAHVVDRSLGGCSDPLCVVPLCGEHHRAYDEGALDLLPYLEPHFRDEQAHAVSHLGIARAYDRLTNTRHDVTPRTAA